MATPLSIVGRSESKPPATEWQSPANGRARHFYRQEARFFFARRQAARCLLNAGARVVAELRRAPGRCTATAKVNSRTTIIRAVLKDGGMGMAG
jgi:hypothetical protein